jgi:putative solute:sodium symporter small subunit
VAAEVAVTEHPGRDRHQLRTLIHAVAVLAAVFLTVVLIVVTATSLNQYWFLHFPLAFYLLAQGLLIFMVIVTFWFVRAQERIDRARSESEGLG